MTFTLESVHQGRVSQPITRADCFEMRFVILCRICYPGSYQESSVIQGRNC